MSEGKRKGSNMKSLKLRYTNLQPGNKPPEEQQNAGPCGSIGGDSTVAKKRKRQEVDGKVTESFPSAGSMSKGVQAQRPTLSEWDNLLGTLDSLMDERKLLIGRLAEVERSIKEVMKRGSDYS